LKTLEFQGFYFYFLKRKTVIFSKKISCIAEINFST